MCSKLHTDWKVKSVVFRQKLQNILKLSIIFITESVTLKALIKIININFINTEPNSDIKSFDIFGKNEQMF